MRWDLLFGIGLAGLWFACHLFRPGETNPAGFLRCESPFVALSASSLPIRGGSTPPAWCSSTRPGSDQHGAFARMGAEGAAAEGLRALRTLEDPHLHRRLAS